MPPSVTSLEDSACALEWTVVSCDRGVWEIDRGCWERDRGLGEVDGGFLAFARGLAQMREAWKGWMEAFVAVARCADDRREALAEMLDALANVTGTL